MNIFQILKRWIEIPVHHRTLFWGFVRNEIKGRFAGSMGGFLWSLLTPLANLLIYIFVFSLILKIRMRPMETGTESFAVYFLAGMLPWIAFSEALGSAADVFLGQANLISKIAFPLEILPTSGVIVPFCLNGLGFAMYLAYLAFMGYAHPAWLWLPVVVVPHMVFTLGLVTLVASLSVFVRDLRQIMGTIISLWFFLTPIVYPLSMVPGKLRWVLKLNPMYPFIDLYHQVLLFHVLSLTLLGCVTGLAILSFLGGALFFNRSKHAFADVL
ncbi:ABC-2 type transporter [delta proteobacterium NaphS2]|nr:ABC-2 type transporter [delta proteobacterium NaphS2]